MTELTLSTSGDSAQAVFNAALESLSFDDGENITVAINFGDFDIQATGDSIAEVRDRFNALQYNDQPTSFSVSMDVSVDDSTDPDVVVVDDAPDDADEASQDKARDAVTKYNAPDRIRANTVEHAALSAAMRHVQQSADWFSDTSSEDFGQFDDGYVLDTKFSVGDIVESEHHPFEVKDTQVGNALLRLFKKGLLDRDRASNIDKDGYDPRLYLYWFTRAGVAEIIRLWEADPKSVELPVADE